MGTTIRLLAYVACAGLLNVTQGSAQTAPPVSSFVAPSDTAARDSMGNVEALPVISFATPRAERPKPTLWRVSLVAMVGANAMDIASSWGKRELNPALAAPSDRFGTSNALIKVGIVGAIMGVEYL